MQLCFCRCDWERTEIKLHWNYPEGQVIWAVVREDGGSLKTVDSTSGHFDVLYKLLNRGWYTSLRATPQRWREGQLPSLSVLCSIIPAFKFILGLFNLFVFIFHHFIASTVKEIPILKETTTSASPQTLSFATLKWNKHDYVHTHAHARCSHVTWLLMWKPVTLVVRAWWCLPVWDTLGQTVLAEQSFCISS